MPVVVLNAKKMPFIARNVELAWDSGLPGLLTMQRSLQDANREKACGSFKKKYTKGSCDEYPMAVTKEGGADARTEEVPLRENNCQGGSFGRRYPPDGGEFLVIIQYPEYAAAAPYAGADIAKDQGYC
jgi:hypothetical protein